jgi:hypothetical protein
MRALASIAALLLLSGCGVAAKVGARNDYLASEANYKNCLAQNSANPHQCDGLRMALEVDERKYQNLTAGSSGGNF